MFVGIAFPDYAATTCGLRMPDVDFAGGQVLLTIEGPQGTTTSPRLEGAIRRLGVLQVNTAKVLDWLTMLKFMNPTYYDIHISDLNVAERETTELINRLIAFRIPLPPAVTAEEQARETSDITRPDASQEHENNQPMRDHPMTTEEQAVFFDSLEFQTLMNLPSTLLMERNHSRSQHQLTSDQLEAVQLAVNGEGDAHQARRNLVYNVPRIRTSR